MSKFKLALESHSAPAVFHEPSSDDENPNQLSSLVKMGQGIEQALESLQTLHKLRKIFAKQQHQRVSKSAIKIGKLALERIKNDVGIFKDNLIIAHECFTEDTVSLEGIKDIARSIWDAIVRTFKALWDAFASLIQINKSEKMHTQVKNDAQNIKVQMKKIKTDPDVEKEAGPRRVPFHVTQPFSYLGGEISLNDLIGELKHIMTSVKIADGAIINLEVANMNMAESVRKMRDEGITQDSTEGVMMAMGFFSSYVKQDFIQANTDELYTLLKSSDSEEAELADKQTLRTLNGVTRGHKLVAYMHALDRENTQVYIRKLTSQPTEVKVSMEYPALENMLDYMENLVKVTEQWRELWTHYEVKAKKIIGHQKALLASLQTLLSIEKFENGRDEDSVNMLQFARSVTNSMIKFSHDITIIVRALELSALDHTKVSSYFNRSLETKTE